MTKIDFQNNNLDPQVYEVLFRTSNMMKLSRRPSFITKEINDHRWECRFEIPGIEPAISLDQASEIESINRCASNMLNIINKLDPRGLYNPETKGSYLEDEIKSCFGDIRFNPEYYYYLFTGDIVLSNSDKYLKNMLELRSKEYYEDFKSRGEEIDIISNIITVKYLIKEKKKNYC